MTRRYVPHTERHRDIVIHGGDGSDWLRDLNKEDDMNRDHPIRRDDWQGSRARQDEALRRMANQPWAAPDAEVSVSWPLAAFIAFIIIIVVVGQFGDLGTLLGASK